MTMTARFVSPAFGLLMVAASGAGLHHGLAIAAAMLAVVAVVAGMVFRPAASFAVLLTISVLVLSDPSPVLAAVSGLFATGYLVLRHAVAGVVPVSPPTIIAALGFTFVGLAATSFPLQLPWLPLLAPLAVLGIYLLATRPFLSDSS
jgi:hypothetical protein